MIVLLTGAATCMGMSGERCMKTFRVSALLPRTLDFDRIDGTVVRQGGHLHADVRGKLHGDFQGGIGAVAVDFDFDRIDGTAGGREVERPL